MEEPYGAKTHPKSTNNGGSSSRLDAQLSAYHAKTLRAQTRLFETLDVLDEMERTHAEQLALNERREGRMRQKMKTYAEVSRKAEEETEDMRQAVLKLIDKVEKNNGYKSVKPSQLHVSSLLDPIEPVAPRHVSPVDIENLLSYASSMIEVVRRERALERKAHQKTKEWAQSRIAVLEAQLSRRETELAQCATHCFSSRDANRIPTHPIEEPMPYQQYLETLQWTISKNKSLELEINSLSNKLTGVRLHDRQRAAEPAGEEHDRSETAAPSTNTQPGLAEQVQHLGSLVDALTEDRKNWRTVLDKEKLTNASEAGSVASVIHRLEAVEEECRRLRSSEENMRRELESTRRDEEVRDSELKQKIALLESRLSAITTNQNEPEDVDTIRMSQQAHSSPRDLESNDLLDDGEASMDLATPLVPTIFLEPPTSPLVSMDSPDLPPQQPPRTPSPFDLSSSPPPPLPS